MAVKKGFLHVTETIIVILLVFVLLFRFSTIPQIRSDWSRPKLELMAHDILYSMDKRGINWFDSAEVKSALSGVLPGSIGFTVSTRQDVRPVISVGCVCDEANFAKLKNEILTDLDLNGFRRSFKFERIAPGSLRFSMDNDVILFWDKPDDMSGDEITNLKRYLSTGRGIVEFSDLTQDKVNSQWHKDIFKLDWVDSGYGAAENAVFRYFSASERGYNVKKLFYGIPHELSDSSLSGYWRLNSDTGGIADDSSGNDNSGVLYNGTNSCRDSYDPEHCPKWTQGKLDNALEFDGKNDYVEVGYGPSMRIRDNFTVSMWVKIKGVTSSTIDTVLWRFTGHDDSRIVIDKNGIVFFLYGLYETTSPEVSSGPVRLGLDTWYHIAAVMENNTAAKLYIDGEEVGSVTGAFDAGTKNLRIGSDTSEELTFNGTIDEVAIFGRALSSGEISQLYSSRFNAAQGFENFVSETVYPSGGAGNKVLVELNGTSYSADGRSVPLAVINWGIEGNGRSAWMSSASLDKVENRHLLRSLIMWAAGERNYDVVTEGGLKQSTMAGITKVLDSDMYELLEVELNLGYFY